MNQIPGACKGDCGTGGFDGFVTKINAAGSALVYSSLLGGSRGDYAMGIAVDNAANAYVTGITYSTDFPVVNQITGACQGSCSVPSFVTKINAAGSALVYSSFIGGSEGRLRDRHRRGQIGECLCDRLHYFVRFSACKPNPGRLPGRLRHRE